MKVERSRQARAFGPCPQDGLCAYCKRPATPKDQFCWGHWPKRFIDGGITAVPMHKSCNEGPVKKNQ